ncbi:response regulator [Candidatus Daviesbacteria bacterium]|nr:response regulator [Candidatus Daviesbacteria bacterium]
MATILIVEDEKEYRDLLAKKLEQAGFNILTASDGLHGINVLKNNTIDLIILDLVMPEMDGNRFFYHLRETLKKDIPVVILTNLTETAHSSVAKDFIVKSNTSLDEVVEKVKANLPYKEEKT